MTQGTPWSAIADKWVGTSTGGIRNVGEHVSGVQIDKFFVPPARQGSSGRWCVVLQDGRTFERHDCYVEWSPHGWNPSSCRREEAEKPGKIRNDGARSEHERTPHEWDDDACCIHCGFDGAEDHWLNDNLRREIGDDEFKHRKAQGEFDAGRYCQARRKV